MITVAPLLQIMHKVGSLDSSRDLQPIRAKSFTNRFYLVLHACVQTFDVIFFGVKFWDLNKALISLPWRFHRVLHIQHRY